MVLPLSLEAGVGVLPLLRLSILCPVPVAYFFSRSFIFLSFFSPSLTQTLMVSLLENYTTSSWSFCFQTLSLLVFPEAVYRIVLLTHTSHVLPLPPNLCWWLWPIESSWTSSLVLKNFLLSSNLPLGLIYKATDIKPVLDNLVVLQHFFMPEEMVWEQCVKLWDYLWHLMVISSRTGDVSHTSLNLFSNTANTPVEMPTSESSVSFPMGS